MRGSVTRHAERSNESNFCYREEMKRAAVLGVLLVLGALPALGSVASCSLVATFDDRPSKDGGAASIDDGARAADAGNGQDGSVEPGVYPNGCSGHAGPEPVKVPGFCIDSTEVTNAQYAQFLEATNNGKPGGQATACAWNATYLPESDWPADAAKASFPVVEVDWCDAYAFCAWAGKRLCGKIGGGASAAEDSARVTDQWFLACSMAGTRPYPYPGAYADDTCNGEEHNVRKALAVGTMPKCEGGFAGIFDMSGNVAEWEDACSGSAGASDDCLLRGGSFESSESKMGCAVPVVNARSSAHGDLGFRCCSSP
jgi:formylglycine-generating enzyme required for sulfatase activity